MTPPPTRRRRVPAISGSTLLLAAAASLPVAQPASAQADPLAFRTLTPVLGQGYAGNNINATSFAFNIATLGEHQVAAWYRPLSADPAGGMSVARRNLRTGEVDVTNLPFTPNRIVDNHDVVSVGISGEGLVHLSWGMHGDRAHYSRSDAPVSGGPLTFNNVGDAALPGGVSSGVTYPEFARLNGGNLLFQYRTGGSGNGDTQVTRWNVGPANWNTGLQKPLIDGSVENDGFTSANAYTNGLTVDANNRIHQTWTFRDNFGPGASQTNHNLYYAYSDNGGGTWSGADGVAYDGPITQTNASRVVTIPKNSDLINQTGMAVDSRNRPVVVSRWSEGGGETRYRLAWEEERGQPWRTSEIADLRGGSRPAVAVLDDWGNDRVLAIYQNNQSNDRITVAHSLDRENWAFIQIDDTDLGGWEGRYDTTRFKEEGVLSFLHVSTNTRDADSEAPVSILDWDAKGYFSLLLHDLNDDAEVDGGDLSLLDAAMGSTGLAGAGHLRADVTRDGVVNAADREQLLLNFTGPLPPVPEPGSLTLLGLGSLALLRRRRRA